MQRLNVSTLGERQSFAERQILADHARSTRIALTPNERRNRHAIEPFEAGWTPLDPAATRLLWHVPRNPEALAQFEYLSDERQRIHSDAIARRQFGRLPPRSSLRPAGQTAGYLPAEQCSIGRSSTSL
jgi:hypothetical protein